jgi:hypothetical protein
MTDKKEGGLLDSLGGFFIKPTDESEEVPPTATSTPNSVKPTLISTLAASAPISVSTSQQGPSPRSVELLKAAQEKVPPDNAQFKLDAAMQSIAALEPDPVKRRTMATAILASQGVSPEKIANDEKRAREIMAAYLNEVNTQLGTKLSESVTSVRERAGNLRQQATELDTEIARIREQQATLNSEATELDASASSEEAALNALSADIQSALALVNS